MGVFGIQVCIVEPGFLRTPMNRAEVALKKMERAWLRQPESIKEEYGEDFYKFSEFFELVKHFGLNRERIHGDFLNKHIKCLLPIESAKTEPSDGANIDLCLKYRKHHNHTFLNSNNYLRIYQKTLN